MPKSRALWGWALYDWANSAWATAVLAGFFPIMFKRVWAADLPPEQSTFMLGLASTTAALIVAIAAPWLGARADALGFRKRAVLVCAALGALVTCGLAWVPEGWALAALAAFGVSALGFALGNAFYDGLLVHVAPRGMLDRASSLGYALGYVGGGLYFAAAAAVAVRPSWLGLTDPAAAMRLGIFGAGLWWLVWLVPFVLWVPEPERARATGAGFAAFARTAKRLFAQPGLGRFLLAYFFYIDGVNAVIRMASDYGAGLGLSVGTLVGALLLVQFVAWPASIAAGRAAERWGAKRVLVAMLLGFVVICLLATRIARDAHYVALAFGIGLVLGGVQALSRSLFARWIPPEASAEAFGFFNMFGKFSSI
ncbi:MAG: MFS transporter, partial [Zetaproteobacteria bacterium]